MEVLPLTDVLTSVNTNFVHDTKNFKNWLHKKPKLSWLASPYTKTCQVGIPIQKCLLKVLIKGLDIEYT